MILQEFTINNLWGDKCFSVKLNKDVNIFSGINGSGKTTIMNILYSILNGNPNEEVCAFKYDNAQLLLTGGFQINVTTAGNKKVMQYIFNGQEISVENFSESLKHFAVSTFDTSPFSDEYRAKIREREPWVRTELDYELADSLQDYYMYIVNLSKQIQNALDQDKTKIKQLRQYYQAMTDMQIICNELFSPALVWDKDSATVQFKLLQYGNKIITSRELSSGEKQMIIFLINTLIQKKEETIVFWDEPEISMHVDWQKILIATMQKINPNMQLIIATHSPFIIYDGWENRVVNIQKLMK